jgi:putative Mg2+ transporter-C (MgtC) family protein
MIEMEILAQHIPENILIVRLIIAAFLGGLIGLEREYHGQPAGLRTHIILSLGASLAMCISINSSYYGTEGDVERIAAQVVSGVGFLGAGAIFKYGGGVRGLTTAASIWTTAMIGMTAGSGMHVVATASTGLVLFTLIILNSFEKSFIHEKITRTIVIKGTDHPRFLEELENHMKKFKISVKSTSFSKDVLKNHIEVKQVIKLQNDTDMDLIIADVQKIEGVESLSCYNEAS